MGAGAVRPLIEEQLRQRLGELGTKVEWDTTVTAATQDADGVTVEFDDGARVRAGRLAGCDGARSTAREAAGSSWPATRRTCSPIGGQGMNTGIGDAENLAWKLALVVRGRVGKALLDNNTTEALRTTTANTRIPVGDGPVARFVRDRNFVPILNSPRVQRQATRTASQLWVSYRCGPLGGRDHVGDRVRTGNTYTPTDTRPGCTPKCSPPGPS